MAGDSNAVVGSANLTPRYAPALEPATAAKFYKAVLGLCSLI